MKRVLSSALSVLLTLLLIGCANQNNESTSSLQLSTTNLETVFSSYYSSQSSHAFSMLKKSIFKSMIDGWTDDDIVNPIWNYDSFAQYQILDYDMVSVADNENLYYCTFSADNDKFGYIVLSYDGSSLQKINVIETSYLYDLQANKDEIADKLSEAEIDLSSAVASRVQLVDLNKKCSDEVIRITDDNGHNYMCYFGKSSIDFIDNTVAP
ncbi:MAG: hypothetical protein ACERKN_02140 [Velocimicrobium sp.]